MIEATIKTVLKLALKNEILLYKIFIWLAEVIVKRTSNDLDNQFLEIVKSNLTDLID